MSIEQITFQAAPSQYQRLLVADINRLPKIKLQKSDTLKIQANTTINKKRTLTQQIFTLSTFGVVGLYIAHRKDLFNPIRREVKKLLKTDAFRNKIHAYVNENYCDELYQKVLKRYLGSLSGEKNKEAVLKAEAKSILEENSKFNELLKNIKANIKEEELSPNEIKDGFFYDLMEKIKHKAEQNLSDNKKYNMPYKDRCAAWVTEQFAPNKDKPRLIDDLFLDVVQGRISADADKLINESVINSKLQSKT